MKLLLRNLGALSFCSGLALIGYAVGGNLGLGIALVLVGVIQVL